MSASRPTPDLEDYPLSAVRDCSFSIFAATLRILRSYLASHFTSCTNSTKVILSLQLQTPKCVPVLQLSTTLWRGIGGVEV